MGISVRVVVEPKWIAKQAWRHVYAETLEVLRAWPDPPMCGAYRTIAGAKVNTYTRDVVEADGWAVCGDARSRTRAETNELPSELGVEHPCEPDSELVLREFADHFDRSLVRLLGNKTQGLPVHALIVAVAMLIEHRFPRAAVVLGDLDRRDARMAQRELELILRERIPLPACVDPERMRARLQPHVEGPALDKAIARALSFGFDACDRVPTILAAMFPHRHSFPPTEWEKLRAAMTCSDVVELSPPTLRIFEAFAHEVDVTAREAGLTAAFEHADADQLLEAIARGSRAVRLSLTDMAWDEILRASLPELRWLAALAWMERFDLGIEAQPAAFESAAVRQLCLQACANWPAPAKRKPNEFVGLSSKRCPYRTSR